MPQIKIISPPEGQTVLGDKVTISFIVSDFSIGQDGYLNLWLDNQTEQASTAAQITSQFDYTLSDLSPGPHKLTLEAVKTNKMSLNPPVKQTVSFTTSSAYVPTITPSPTPFNIFFLTNSINWQYAMLVAAVIIVALGVILKSTFGKPKIWK